MNSVFRGLRLGNQVLAVFVMLPLVAALPGQLHAQPFAVQGTGVSTNDFRVTTFATGLNFPLGMAQLSDGSLLVTISQGANYLTSMSGYLLRLTDTNLNGFADGAGSVVYTNLPGTLTGVRVAGSLVLVIGSAKPIYVLRAGALPGDPLTLVGRLLITYPVGWSQHQHSGLNVRARPGFTNQFDIVFQIGSQSNFGTTTNTASLTNENISGASGVLSGDSLYLLTLIDNGTSVTASNLTRLVSGVRNPSGFGFHPATGDLIFQDNGIDGLVDGNEPLSADELNFLARTNLGGAVEFYGYPSNYCAYRSNVVVGGLGVQPLIAFRPQPNPATGHESEGANDLAFAPAHFPNGLNTGVFVGFHGRFNNGGTANEENPVIYADPVTGNYFHFIEGQQAGIGHLDGLLGTRDSLFIADLVTNGNTGAGANAGVIYQIKSLVNPTPPSLGFRRVGSSLEVSWNRGALQQAAAPVGPWTNVPDAFSPYSLPPTAASRYFRTRY